jgi:hypothetical protein
METSRTYADFVTDRPTGKETTRSRHEELLEHLRPFRGFIFGMSFGLLAWAAIIRLLF